MAGRLAGKVALITGASSGIGQAAAIAFAREGAAGIGINYAKSEAGARDTLAAIEKHGSRGMLLQADVSDEARVRAMIGEHIQHFGKLGILVNNAATTFFIDLADFESMTEDKWDRIYAVNVKGLFWCTRAAAPALRTAKGCVINIASMAGFSGKGSSIAYGASKAAVIALTKGLASAMAPDVRVNAIAPGMVDSPWNTGRSERVQRAAAGTPLGRVPTSADIGEVVLDLASGFSLATGMTVQIDGGASL